MTQTSPTSKTEKEAPDSWSRLIGTIILDRKSPMPLHAQLFSHLHRMILSSADDGKKFVPEEELVEALGISRGTVRRALAELAGRGLLERARSTGTIVRRPSVKNLVKNLVIITPDPGSPVSAEIMASLYEEGNVHGSLFKVIRLNKASEWISIAKQIPFSPLEGAVILLDNARHITLGLHNRLTEQGYRTVNVDTFIVDYPGSHVGIDNRAAVWNGMEILTGYGHRKIVFLESEPEERDATHLRVNTFEEYVKTHHLRESTVLHCGAHLWEDSALMAEEAVCMMAEQHRLPTAIFGISDNAALGAFHGLKKMGLRIPEDVSLLSIDGTEWGNLVRPKISSIRQPFNLFGKNIFEILTTEDPSPQRRFLQPGFIPRESLKKLSAAA